MSILDLIKTHQVTAKKSLGQNFLIDQNIQKKIVEALDISPADSVVEIGPGVGSLTQWLLQSPAKKLTLIEKDHSLVELLKTLNFDAHKPTTIQEADALTLSLKDLSTKTPLKLISNLPYNISTPLIINWLKDLSSISSMVLMIQKEVAERIVAPAHSKSYGRLSILCQWLCTCELLFHVPPTVFRPQPKVTSTVVRLTPHKDLPTLHEIHTMEKATHLLFQKRRKMLKAILKTHVENPIAFLENLGITPTARPENLSIQEFSSLAKALFDCPPKPCYDS